MKRQFGKTLQHIAALTLGVFLTLGPAAQAATNTGTGDIGGVSAALGSSNAFDLSSSGALTLVKTAFQTVSGAQLSSTDTVPAGTSVDFMIYLNNESSVAINDVSIQDVLDVAFTKGVDNIHIDTAVADCGASCDATEEAAIYASAIATGPLTDAAGDDTVSFAALTVDAGNSVVVTNTRLDVPANRVLALVFTVIVP
jgi:hypothetical protein